MFLTCSCTITKFLQNVDDPFRWVVQVISRDPYLSGINAQARRLQKSRSRVASLFVESGGGGDMEALSIWRSLSEMDLMTMGKEAGRARHGALREDPEADKEALQLGTEKEETESSDDNTTQFSIHPPFDFPYFLLLQGYNHRQVRGSGRSQAHDSRYTKEYLAFPECQLKHEK